MLPRGRVRAGGSGQEEPRERLGPWAPLKSRAPHPDLPPPTPLQGYKSSPLVTFTLIAKFIISVALCVPSQILCIFISKSFIHVLTTCLPRLSPPAAWESPGEGTCDSSLTPEPSAWHQGATYRCLLNKRATEQMSRNRAPRISR